MRAPHAARDRVNCARARRGGAVFWWGSASTLQDRGRNLWDGGPEWFQASDAGRLGRVWPGAWPRRMVGMSGMDNFTKYAQHTHKLFSCSASLMLPNHRLLPAHTVEISTEGLKVVVSENLPEHLDCLIRLNVPVKPAGAHTVIAHVETLGSIFDGKHGGFLVELKFTAIAAQAAGVVKEFLEG